MNRRIVSKNPIQTRNRFRVGRRVVIDGDCTGDYHGVVVQNLPVTMARSVHDTTMETRPGMIILVDRWEGVAYDNSHPCFAPFEIQAWDEQVLHTEEPGRVLDPDPIFIPYDDNVLLEVL